MRLNIYLNLVFAVFYIKDEIGTVELNEAQGLRCITEGGGDVTFIDFNLIDKYLCK